MGRDVTLNGIDVSNHQSSPSTYRSQPWYQEAQFVIAQAIPRPFPDGYTGEQLRAAKADGKYVGAYLWLWHDPTWRMGGTSVELDQRMRLATIPDDVPLDMRLWLDVEDNQSTGWNSVSIPQRVDDVNRALAVLDEWSYARGLPEAGIYWSTYFINLLFGGVDYFGRKQWKAHYGIEPGSLIGGPCVAHQYTSTPVDKNVMLESEIVTASQPEPPPVEEPDVPCEDPGWQDKKPMVVQLAGELVSVADQLLAEANRPNGPRKTVVRKLADEALRDRAEQILA
jgi:hypothetical protein